MDILDAAAQNVEVALPETERKEEVEKTNAILPPLIHTEKEEKKSDEEERSTKNRTDKPNLKNGRIRSSKKPHIYSERDIQSVLTIQKRATERYSFEIYSDQKEDIQASVISMRRQQARNFPPVVSSAKSSILLSLMRSKRSKKAMNKNERPLA